MDIPLGSVPIGARLVVRVGLLFARALDGGTLQPGDIPVPVGPAPKTVEATADLSFCADPQHSFPVPVEARSR